MLSLTRISSVAFLSFFLGLENSTNSKSFPPTRGIFFFSQRVVEEALVIAPTPAPHPLQHQLPFQPSSSSSLHVRSSLLLHQPLNPTPPHPGKIHSLPTPPPHPPPSLTCARAGLPPPPAELNGLCLCRRSRLAHHSAQPGSARLS